MTRRRVLLIALAVAALALIAAPAALAGAGGGSSAFGGGGGGGGGGGHGSGFALFILIRILIDIALLGHGLGLLFLIGLGLLYLFFTRVYPNMQARRAARAGGRRRTEKRERRVELAAAEAAEEDPAFAPDNVRATARQLFLDIQHAWDADDRTKLRGLVGTELMAEWERRLDDFQRHGWRNRVEPQGEPSIDYVGLTHTGELATDRVVVRVDAKIKDYVVDGHGRRMKRRDALTDTTRIREFWTLQRRSADHWVLTSIEQGAEGTHALDADIVATPWSDETGLRDEALIEGAVADAVPENVKISEVADLQFEGDAHSAANDLSVADGRFAPDLLEIAARRAIDGWARAVDGSDTELARVATPQAARELLYAGDTSGHTRIVVRGLEVKRIRIVGLDAAAQPPTMTMEVDITGRRYVEDRDTAAVLAGSKTRRSSFTERWTLSLTSDEQQPWRITSVGSPVGLA